MIKKIIDIIKKILIALHLKKAEIAAEVKSDVAKVEAAPAQIEQEIKKEI